VVSVVLEEAPGRCPEVARVEPGQAQPERTRPTPSVAQAAQVEEASLVEPRQLLQPDLEACALYLRPSLVRYEERVVTPSSQVVAEAEAARIKLPIVVEVVAAVAASS
jgi:hypothetical protein